MKPAKITALVFIAIFLPVLLYLVFQSSGKNIITEIQNFFSPCANPITYRIGSIDNRFGVSEKELAGILLQAESIWEKPMHKNLFEFGKDGAMVINLIYDYRQEATDQ